MSEDVKVETATPNDEEAVMDLCRLLHAENGMFRMNEDKVRAYVRRAISKDRGLLGVIRIDGKPVAAVCLVIDGFWYTDDEHIGELFNFVHPEHRKSNYAKLLIEFAKACSDRMSDLGLPLFIGVLSTERTEAKVRLYRRLIEPAGAFFIHNRNLGQHETEPVMTEAA